MPSSHSFRSRLSFAAIGVAMLAIAACGDSTTEEVATTGSGGVDLVVPGRLTVCTNMSFKPFQFNKDGEIVGFDVDLGRLVAEDLGVQQEIVDVEFRQIWSGAAFEARRCDLGIAGISITDSRRTTVAFSEPYFDATQALLVEKGSDIRGFATLRGKSLAVQAGTTGQEFAEKNRAANGYEVVVFDDLPLGVEAVKSGRVDAAINDNGVLLDFAKDNPDTQVVAQFNTGERYGVAARKDEPSAARLLRVVDATIAKARSDGTYDSMYEKWFGTRPGVEPSASSPTATGTTGSNRSAG